MLFSVVIILIVIDCVLVRSCLSREREGEFFLVRITSVKFFLAAE